ncbi:MFS transporter [Streptacidiphilus griseoplanus]|uniref:MFS transporter n=1 Tax=Peterkaempfera griseoplana TaxID=66896 RepID=UPI0007C6E37C|nr:MFS transporter [Peterkaempfera griseoplana]
MLSTRNVPQLLAGTLIGRLPAAMAPIALLQTAHQRSDPVLAGLLAALYGLAAVAGQPLLGRAVDRRRRTTVLATSAAVSAVAFTALATTGPARHPMAAGLLTAVAGAATPPLEAGLRALWPHLVRDPALRRAAFALDSTAQEIIYVTGPLLAALLSGLLSPAAALAVCAALGAAGTAVVCTTPASRPWHPHPRTAERGVPLRAPGLRFLLAAHALLGVSLGAVNVAALDLANRHHTPWLTGALPAAMSAASLLGGTVFGQRCWPGSHCAQLLACTAGFAAGWLPLAVGPDAVTAAGFAIAPGLFLAPLLACSFLLLDELAPAGTATEAGGWLIAAMGLGQATGTGTSGPLGPHSATALPALAAASALTVLVVGRRHLNIAQRTAPSTRTSLEGTW